ncbi:MAG: sulfatase-like hydrolase/transferase [Bdellovibrionaceae bacterium]|nr:sulfatase-like hydrolase/transferase [Pseudobdellovibrionaceae bacterium]
MSWHASEGADLQHTDGLVALEAIHLMKNYREEGSPFFLAVGFYKPHTPFVAPKRYFEMYDKSKIVVPTVPEGYLDTIPEPAVRSIRKKDQIDLPEDTARSAIHAYHATISYLDARRRLLDALETLGIEGHYHCAVHLGSWLPYG